VALPSDDGPPVAVDSRAQVEQVDGIADREVARLPPRVADALVVGAEEEVEARAAERPAILEPRVDRVLRHERRLVPDVGRLGRRLDLAVGRAVAEEELEMIRDAAGDVELEAAVIDLVEAAQVLRRAVGQEDEEIAALGVGIEHAEVQAHAAVGELALQAELERLGNLRVEQVADARDARRADSGLIEAAAPEALAVAAEEGEVLGRRIAQGHARLKLVP